MKALIFCSLFVLLLSACARNMVVSYHPESNDSGRIILKPSKPTEKTYVSINDKLVIDKGNIKSVTINNVPVGNNIVHYNSDYRGFKNKLDTKFYVNMDPNGLVSQAVVVPPYKPVVYVGPALSLLLGIGLFTGIMSEVKNMP